MVPSCRYLARAESPGIASCKIVCDEIMTRARAAHVVDVVETLSADRSAAGVGAPQWLSRLRRVRAALAGGHALAREDAAILLAAIDAAAASNFDDGLHTLEQGLGLPAMWRTLLRNARRDDVLNFLFVAGYRGRGGAKRLCNDAARYQRVEFQRDRRARCEPKDESLKPLFHLLIACNGILPSERHLARLLK